MKERSRHLYYITNEKGQFENIGSDMDVEDLQDKLTPSSVLNIIKALRGVRQEIRNIKVKKS